MGFRNPYRFSLRPGTGNPNPAAADPGTLYIGDVGWGTIEELNVVPTGGAAANCGWPIFEGLTQNTGGYVTALTDNLSAPNPLAGGYGVYSFWMFEDGEASVEVFDSTGKPVQNLLDTVQLLEDPQQLVIDWTGFSPGVYFIRLRALGNDLVVKVVR